MERLGTDDHPASEGDDGAMVLCAECAQVLTDTERLYYGHRCERCEIDDHDRLQAWREGGEDPELDARFADRPPASRWH